MSTSPRAGTRLANAAKDAKAAPYVLIVRAEPLSGQVLEERKDKIAHTRERASSIRGGNTKRKACDRLQIALASRLSRGAGKAPMPTIQVREYINQAQGTAALAIQRSTVCFFGEYEGFPIPHGSGVLVQIDDAHFIFTAAHVARFVKEGITLMVSDLAAPGSFLTLAGGTVVTSEGDGGPADPFDVAVVRLPLDTATRLATTKRFLRLSDVDTNHRATRGTWYYMQGFPSSPAMPDVKTQKVVARFLRVGGLRKSPPEPDFDGALYIDVDVPNVGMIDQSGAPAVIGPTDGVSGCGLWWLFDTRDVRAGTWPEEGLRYLGVVHTWRTDREYIRATRVEYALQWFRARGQNWRPRCRSRLTWPDRSTRSCSDDCSARKTVPRRRASRPDQ